MIRTSVVVLMLASLVGCSQSTNKPNWDLIVPVVQMVAQEGATIAFQQPSVAPHKTEICTAVTQVADALDKFDDPNATLDTLRQMVLAKLDKLNLPASIKDVVVSVVDNVISAAFATIQQNYADLIKQDQAQAALIISKATANGLRSACQTKMKVARKAPSFLFPKK